MSYSRSAYYVNNLIMIVFAVLLAYMTVSSALPSWLPFGGQSLSAGTYNAIAPVSYTHLYECQPAAVHGPVQRVLVRIRAHDVIPRVRCMPSRTPL